jgi:hypothetical protein
VLMAVNPDFDYVYAGPTRSFVSLLLCVTLCRNHAILLVIIFHIVCILSQTGDHLQITLKNLTSLKAILSLQSNPTINSASLDTNHLLVTILGLEISDGFGAFSPWVPDDGVLHVVSDDIETGFVVYEDGGCVLREGLVDAVDGAFDAEVVALGVVLGGVEDFVCVSDAGEAGDLDFGDVLKNHVSVVLMREGRGGKHIREWQSRCGRGFGSRRACRPDCERSAWSADRPWTE